MKRKIFNGTFLLLCIFSFFIFGKENHAGYSITDDVRYANVQPLGQTVNMVTYGLDNINRITSKSIYNDTYKNQIKEDSRNNIHLINEMDSKSTIDSNVTEFSKKMIKLYTASSCSEIGGEDFYVGLSYNYSNVKKANVSEYSSNMVAYYSYSEKYYSVNLNREAIDTNKLTTNNRYDSYFLNDLIILLNNRTFSGYKSFFENYGTHLLFDVVMGASVEAYLAAYSSKYTISKNAETSLASKLEATVKAIISGNSMASINMQSVNNYDKSEVINTYKTYIHSIGGNGFEVNLNESKNQQQLSVTNWSSTINQSNINLLDVKENGLIPIWKMLPTNYSNIANEMEEYYYQYAVKYGTVEDVKSSLKTGKIAKQLIRDSEYRITDAGWLKNKNDILNHSTITNMYTIQEYIDAGYTKMAITVEIEYANIDEGYQWFALCTRVCDNCDTSQYKIIHERRAASSNKYRGLEWNSVVVDLNKVIDDTLVLMYTASGSSSDDWKNKNLYVTIDFS